MKKIYLILILLFVLNSCTYKFNKKRLEQCKVYSKINKIAKDMDPNRNNHINQKEYLDYLTMRFNKSDINKDKIHSEDEFMEMFVSNYLKDGETLDNECEFVMNKVIKKGKLCFKIVDANNSNQIEFKEFIEEHKKIFKKADYNNNGTLELNELITFML